MTLALTFLCQVLQGAAVPPNPGQGAERVLDFHQKARVGSQVFRGCSISLRRAGGAGVLCGLSREHTASLEPGRFECAAGSGETHSLPGQFSRS